jgi:hypothetical protein
VQNGRAEDDGQGQTDGGHVAVPRDTPADQAAAQVAQRAGHRRDDQGGDQRRARQHGGALDAERPGRPADHEHQDEEGDQGVAADRRGK